MAMRMMEIIPASSTGQIVKNIEKITPMIASHHIFLSSSVNAAHESDGSGDEKHPRRVG